jgi:capsular exopolysaccharide synthesis family protein
VNLAIGLLAGLLLGCVATLLAHQADRTIKSPEAARELLELPELGVIPSLDRMFGGRERREFPSNDSARERAAAKSRRHRSALATVFGATVTSLLQERGQAPRVLVVTSAAPEEGKSTVACNLAIAAGETGRRALLIDANLQTPCLHAQFDLPNASGLSSLLADVSGQAVKARRTLIPDADDTRPAPVLPTGIPGVFLLPGGPPAKNASRLFKRERFAGLLARFRREFDVVIIDAPDLLSADTRLLGRLADGAVLVLRLGKTTRSAALAAKRRLVEDRIPILGTVLNDCHTEESECGYQEPPRTAPFETPSEASRLTRAAAGD